MSHFTSDQGNTNLKETALSANWLSKNEDYQHSALISVDQDTLNPLAGEYHFTQYGFFES